MKLTGALIICIKSPVINFGEISNRTVHQGKILGKKGNIMRGIAFFPLSPKHPKMSCLYYNLCGMPIQGLFSRERKKKLSLFCSGTTQFHSCFQQEEKNSSTCGLKRFAEFVHAGQAKGPGSMHDLQNFSDQTYP